MSVASQKTAVVDHLWDVLQKEGALRPLTFKDVEDAIDHCNATLGSTLSQSNIANFMKDLLRGANASKNWPTRLASLGITGRQVTGANRSFEFIPYPSGQTEPFPNPFEPTGSEPEFVVQSVSIPLATKSLGRQDESWLIQVAVQLRLLETHFATLSSAGVCELVHLQTGVKLNRTEIDSLFLAVVLTEDGERKNALVTCEAKQQKDPILGDQVSQQVVSAYKSVKDLGLNIHLMIPVALKALKNRSAVYVAEFEPWSTDEAEAPEGQWKELVVSCGGTYRLNPPVPGIGYKAPKPKKVGKKPAL